MDKDRTKCKNCMHWWNFAGSSLGKGICTKFESRYYERMVKSDHVCDYFEDVEYNKNEEK